MKTGTVWMLAAALLAWTIPAQAHFPNLSDGSYDDAESAFQIEDPDVSMVLYHEVTCDALQLWLAFDGDEGFPLVAQLAVPVLERLTDYRPSLALVGPGLPAPQVELPFALPAGAGAQVWDTTDIEPEAFFEPFTGTNSWILASIRDLPLPATGRYWLVAWSPTRETGKLWVVIGIQEDFSGITDPQEFTAILNGVKDFHEKSGERDVEEQVCPEDAGPDPDGGGHDDDGHDDDGHAHDDDLDDGTPDAGTPDAGTTDVGTTDEFGAAAANGGADGAGDGGAGGGCAASPGAGSSGTAPAGPGAAFLLLLAGLYALRVASFGWASSGIGYWRAASGSKQRRQRAS